MYMCIYNVDIYMYVHVYLSVAMLLFTIILYSRCVGEKERGRERENVGVWSVGGWLYVGLSTKQSRK